LDTEKMENSMFKSLIKFFTGGSDKKEEQTPQYLSGNETAKPKAAPTPKAKAEVQKASVTEAALKKMTKKQIDDWAAEQGVTLDRRLTKDKMIAELKTHTNKVNIS